MVNSTTDHTVDGGKRMTNGITRKSTVLSRSTSRRATAVTSSCDPTGTAFCSTTWRGPATWRWGTSPSRASVARPR